MQPTAWQAVGRAHFGLTDRGIIAPGRPADIVLLDDLDSCAVSQVIRAGRPVDEESFAHRTLPAPVGYGSVKRAHVNAQNFAVPCAGPTGPVIGLRINQIITDALTMTLPWRDGQRHADPAQNVAKIAVLERHGKNGNIGRGFVHGFGLQPVPSRRASAMRRIILSSSAKATPTWRWP